MSDDNKKIEIVTGDGSDLDISPVYDHLNSGKPKTTDQKPKNIVIPQVNEQPNLEYRKSSTNEDKKDEEEKQEKQEENVESDNQDDTENKDEDNNSDNNNDE